MTMAPMLLPGMPGHLTPERMRLAAAAHLTPEERKENLEQAVKDVVKRQDDAILEDLKTGLSVFAREDATTRRQRFMALTMPEDVRLLVRPKYWDEVEQGLAPPPISPWWVQLLPVRKLAREHLRKEFVAALRQSIAALRREDPELATLVEQSLFETEDEV